MWNLTKDGFVSIVAYDPKKDRDKSSPFPEIAKQAGTHLLVRARRMEHLEPLKRVVPKLTIVDDRGADYRFRCVVKREQYKQFLCMQVDDIDYWSHFKEAMRAAQPPHLKEPMYSAAMKIWGIFAGMQSSIPYQGQDRKPSKGAPATTSVADYQASRGVKPFKGGKSTNPFQKPGEPKSSPADDQWVADLDKTLASVPSATKPELNVEDVVSLIASRKGDVRFGSTDLQKMDDTAFELVTRLQEKYGIMATVSPKLVTKMRDEVVSA